MSKSICLPSCRLIFDRRKKVGSSTDLGSVELEVCYRRNRKWISTGVRVKGCEWDDARSRVVKRADLVELNERLSLWVQRMYEFFAQCQRKGVDFSMDMVEKVLEGKDPDKLTDQYVLTGAAAHLEDDFICWIDERIRNRQDLREGTLKTHASFLNMLRSFNEAKGYGRIVLFKDLTKVNVLDFDNYLHSRSLSQTTIHGYHKRLKRYCNEAVMMELLERSPYELVRISRGKSAGVRYLTKAELQSMKDAELSGRLDKVRDLFIFQCYTGMAYADMASFDFNLCEERNGRYWIRDNRVKSDEVYEILLLPAAMNILNKWNMELPVISNQQYNLALKVLADKLDIKINLTTHVGRHTFAVLCLNEGIQIETLAKMMGHNQIQTTQIYAKVLGKTVENAFLSLEKSV